MLCVEYSSYTYELVQVVTLSHYSSEQLAFSQVQQWKFVCAELQNYVGLFIGWNMQTKQAML
jgi:hypothetical protein